MSNQQELMQNDSGALAHSDVDPVLVMIQSAARDTDTDVEKMERLMTMYERQQAKKAESYFAAAMNRAQRKMGRVSADAVNPLTRSTYASYAALDRVLRPIYTDEGLSLSFDTGDTDKPETVRVVCHVSHESGHTRTYHVDMPADGKGAKGNAVMTATHAAGSAMSYGMRYLLKLIFNVAIGEDDDDGNAAGRQVEYITEQQVADLEALIGELGDKLDRKAFNNWLIKSQKVANADLDKIPEAIYKDVVRMLERKRAS